MSRLVADVAVIGGGIVGLSCTLELLWRGRSVTVIDPGQADRRASHGNAGVISRGSILPVAGPAVWRNLLRYALGRDPAVRIRHRSLPLLIPWMRRFLAAANQPAVWRTAEALNPLVAAAYDTHAEFARRIGGSDLIARRGWMKLYRSEAAFLSSAPERCLLAHFGVQAETLRDGDIYGLEPALARRFSHALIFPQTGSVRDPGALVGRYADAARQSGAAWVEGSVGSLRPMEAGIELPLGDGRTILAQRVVVAAGAWSNRLAAPLGSRVPLVGERGYHRHFRPAGEVELTRPVFDTGGGYVLSPMNGTVRVLSGVELAMPDDAPDFSQLDAVIADAARTLPLGKAVPGSSWHGSRPSTPDGLPVIGPAPTDGRVLFAFGHGHIGLSTGPVTGRIVADLICGLEPAVSLAPFRVDRPSDFPSGPR